MSNTTIDFQVKRLVRTMEQSYKRWSRPDGSPTISDVAENVKSWMNDINRLGAYTEINGPSYSKAVDGISNAWNHRDNSKKAIGSVKDVITALKNIAGEMQTPEYKTARENRTTKSLFGDFASRYASDPNLFSEIYSVRRMLTGFQSMKSVDMVDPIALRDGADKMMEIASRYDKGLPIHNLTFNASKYMSAASRDTNPRRLKSCLDAAIKMIDMAGQVIEEMYSPKGYKSEMKGSAADDVLKSVDAVQTLMYGYSFKSPHEFLPGAIKSVRNLIATMSNYYDPKALRMANAALDYLNTAYKGSAATKSIHLNGWQYSDVANPFNAALNTIDALARHVSNRKE